MSQEKWTRWRDTSGTFQDFLDKRAAATATVRASRGGGGRPGGSPGPGRGHTGYYKEACVHGHPFDEANTIITKRGKRVCRICKNATARAAWKKKGAKA
jgi:hypothetical protein